MSDIAYSTNSTPQCCCCLATDIWKKSKLNWKLKISNAADNADITQSDACDTMHRRMQKVNSLCINSWPFRANTVLCHSTVHTIQPSSSLAGTAFNFLVPTLNPYWVGETLHYTHPPIWFRLLSSTLFRPDHSPDYLSTEPCLTTFLPSVWPRCSYMPLTRKQKDLKSNIDICVTCKWRNRSEVKVTRLKIAILFVWVCHQGRCALHPVIFFSFPPPLVSSSCRVSVP